MRSNIRYFCMQSLKAYVIEAHIENLKMIYVLPRWAPARGELLGPVEILLSLMALGFVKMTRWLRVVVNQWFAGTIMLMWNIDDNDNTFHCFWAAPISDGIYARIVFWGWSLLAFEWDRIHACIWLQTALQWEVARDS